ncbi:MAG: hypothetical protein VXW65_00345 [Pseudomonadota bacterium]|nr:hypothetical protein [Pseudomonadota bacterium]
MSALQTVRIYPVERQEDGSWARSLEGDTTVVMAIPVGDAVLSQSINWNSPFENAGLESVAGNTTSLLQTGELGQIAKQLGLDNQFIRNAENRSSMTLLNSTQIFSGQPPADLPLTLRFRAIKDPFQEVETPIHLLASWAVSQEIKDGGLVQGAIEDAQASNLGLDTILPTRVPLVVCVEYGRRVFSPMVIESFSESINTKVNSKGHRTECEFSLKLQSLFAWDRARYNQTYRDDV